MKLVGYCRVSSVSQEDNTSLDYQEDRIRRKCIGDDHDLVQVFKEVKSGKDTDRKQYQQMLDMLPLVDGIIVTKIDRLGRSALDLLKLVDEVLEPAGKHLIVVEQKIDTSDPMGKMLLTMMGAMAEMERNLINERTSAGRARKKAAGGYIGGGTRRYGYRFDPKAKAIVEHKEEQKIIAMMVKLYEVDGLLYKDIANELNRLEIPTKLGSTWTWSKVGAIFRAMGKDKPIRQKAKNIARRLPEDVKRPKSNLLFVSDVVKTKIVELRGQGFTQKQIAVELNAMGLTSTKGGKFDQALVSRIAILVGL